MLDDYSALENRQDVKSARYLFQPRTAKWYVPRSNLGTGMTLYRKKPDFEQYSPTTLQMILLALKRNVKKEKKL